MTKIQVTLFISLLGILVIACDKKETIDFNELIIGEWQSENITFNGIDGSEITDWIESSTVLGIDAEQNYYRNYVVGSWSVEDSKLTLTPAEFLEIDTWNYEILFLSEDQLTLKLNITEGSYCCDFDQFESNEVLEIVETYVR